MRTPTETNCDLRLSGLQLPQECTPLAGDLGIGTTRPATQFSLCQLTTYRWTLAEDLVHYAETGIGAIGLYRPKVEAFDEDLAIDLIRSSGLNVSSLSWIGGFTGSDGNPQAEAMYDAREALRLASAVDAETVAIITGGLGRHIGKQARRLMCDALHEICDEAETWNLRLALHPFSRSELKSRTLIRSLTETLSLIDQLDRAPLGLVLDLQELSSDEMEQFGNEEAISQLIPLLHCVRISDRRSSHPRRRLRFGQRLGKYIGLLRDLIAAGYQGPIEFDLFSENDRPVEQYEPLVRECQSAFEAAEATWARC